MDKKMLTIILAILLIAGFFLPYVSMFGMNISGFDMIKAPGGNWEKYVTLIIPIAAVLLLVGAMNNENYFISRSILAFLPLLGVLFIMFLSPLISGAAIGDIFKAIGKGYGIGLWITIAASVVLAFYQPKARS